MSIAKSFHTWINSESGAPAVEWDVVPDGATFPYYSMVAESSEQLVQFCESDGGDTTLEIAGYSQDRNTLYEDMDTLRELCMAFRGTRDGYDVWRVRTTGVTGEGNEETRVYRFAFGLIISWSK